MAQNKFDNTSINIILIIHLEHKVHVRTVRTPLKRLQKSI